VVAILEGNSGAGWVKVAKDRRTWRLPFGDVYADPNNITVTTDTQPPSTQWGLSYRGGAGSVQCHRTDPSFAPFVLTLSGRIAIEVACDGGKGHGLTMRHILLLGILGLWGCSSEPKTASIPALPPPDSPWQVEEYIPESQRVRFRNPDGSCVQCSLGMVGTHHDNPQAECLLWDVDLNGDGKISSNERRVRGGSGPSRVRAYCNARQIPAYNVTGDNTLEWLEWAGRTGRQAAIYFTSNHMQTFLDVTEDGQKWRVCDNNSPTRIDEYTREEFWRRHRGMPWVVILKEPPAPPTPEYFPWWEI